MFKLYHVSCSSFQKRTKLYTFKLPLVLQCSKNFSPHDWAEQRKAGRGAERQGSERHDRTRRIWQVEKGQGGAARNDEVLGRWARRGKAWVGQRLAGQGEKGRERANQGRECKAGPALKCMAAREIARPGLNSTHVREQRGKAWKLKARRGSARSVGAGREAAGFFKGVQGRVEKRRTAQCKATQGKLAKDKTAQG